MSTTPRTDAALLSSDCACNCGHTFKLLIEEKYDQGKCVCTGPDIAHGNDGVVVLADFARTLETELAAAKEEAAHYMSVAQKATDDLARLRADNLTAHKMACAAGLERDQLRAEVERLTKQIKDDNRAYGCELRDPNGTIWEQAAKDHARAERAEAEIATERERLDYLALNMGTPRVADALNCDFSRCFPIRDAIDAAMKT